MFRTKWTAYDLLIAFSVLALSVVLFVSPWNKSTEGTVLVVSTNTETFEYSLQIDREISISSNEIDLKILIRNGKASVTESTCPDKHCQTMGQISKSGETIVCAPAMVQITVKGERDNVDFVAG